MLSTPHKACLYHVGARSSSGQESRFRDGRAQKRRAWALKTDRTLQLLVADLVAARTAAGMTQEAVAARMWTTRSVVSRLESGVCTRPLRITIEKYAIAVGALVEIRVRASR